MPAQHHPMLPVRRTKARDKTTRPASHCFPTRQAAPEPSFELWSVIKANTLEVWNPRVPEFRASGENHRISNDLNICNCNQLRQHEGLKLPDLPTQSAWNLIVRSNIPTHTPRSKKGTIVFPEVSMLAEKWLFMTWQQELRSTIPEKYAPVPGPFTIRASYLFHWFTILWNQFHLLSNSPSSC